MRMKLCFVIHSSIRYFVIASTGIMLIPASAQTSRMPSANDDVRSCRVFTQKFYDWYWNRFADKANDLNFDEHKLHWYDDAVKLKPAVLSPELIGLIKKDQAAQKATGGIVNLDFDPFLNSQDPQGKYLVSKVIVTQNHCMATFDRHSVVAELKKSGSSWLFINFHYAYYSEDGKKKEFPDNDLIHILSN